MFHPLDIFRVDSDGRVLWLGTVESFAAAKARIDKLGGSSPAQYLFLDQLTGRKVRVVLGTSTPASSLDDVLTAVECVVRPIHS